MLRAMNIEQIKSLATTLLAAIGGFFAGWGQTEGGFVPNWESISGVLLAIVVLAYKAYANREDAVIQAAAAMENVEKVVIGDPVKARELSRRGALVTAM